MCQSVTGKIHLLGKEIAEIIRERDMDFSSVNLNKFEKLVFEHRKETNKLLLATIKTATSYLYLLADTLL